MLLEIQHTLRPYQYGVVYQYRGVVCMHQYMLLDSLLIIEIFVLSVVQVYIFGTDFFQYLENGAVK